MGDENSLSLTIMMVPVSLGAAGAPVGLPRKTEALSQKKTVTQDLRNASPECQLQILPEFRSQPEMDCWSCGSGK